MSCDHQRAYESGDLDEAAYQNHARQCPSCREFLRRDAELVAVARSLKQPVAAPLLWDRIEAGLRSEMQDAGGGWRLSFREHRSRIYGIAAVLVLSLGLASYLYRNDNPEPEPRLLSRAALARVEQKQQEYVAAIEELERTASTHLADMDLDLMLLYEDKLETIDAQIARCRDALRRNPANTHIRRYLLLALQDKKDALQEVVGHTLEM